MDTPFVTIVITSYNYARYLRQAIESVIAQTFKDYELIIIDDGSTDQSHEIIKEYAEKHSRIRMFLHSENKGLFARIEESTALSRGPYIHWLSADDYYLPTFLEKSCALLKKFPECAICTSNFGFIKEGEEERLRTSQLIKETPSTVVFDKKEMLKVFQRTHFWIPGSSSLFKKSDYIKYKMLNPHLRWYSDWYLSHKIALNESIGYIPEALTVYRMHPKCYSNDTDNIPLVKKTYKTMLNVLEKEESLHTFKAYIKSTLLKGCFSHIKRELVKPKYWSHIYFLGVKFIRWKLHKKIKGVYGIDSIAHTPF